MNSPQQAAISQFERIVSFVAVGLAIIAFVALMAVLSAPLFGVAPEAMAEPGWQATFLTAYLGFPLAFVLMISLILTRIVQNRRARQRLSSTE